jgi:NDP-sugar pyrophosphorylase family protein
VKAMILAAGLGTRLKPLTDERPKALVSIAGLPMLEWAIRKVSAEGFDEITVNIHHFADQVTEYLRKRSFPEITLQISDESNCLLDTGGAILHARSFLDGREPFLVYNTDIITDAPLRKIYQHHLDSGNLATLCVSERLSGRYFLFGQGLQLTGWCDERKGHYRWVSSPQSEFRKLAFSGIHFIHPDIFDLFTESGRFSIVDAYLRLAKNHAIGAFDISGQAWFDLGRPEQLAHAGEYLSNHPEILSS